MSLREKLENVRKALVALAGLVGILVTFGVVSSEQAAQIAATLIALATAVGVWVVPNADNLPSDFDSDEMPDDIGEMPEVV
jgi:hypothetical protein